MKLGYLARQMHGIQYLLCGLLPLAERDQVERGLALRAEELEPKCLFRELAPRNVV